MGIDVNCSNVHNKMASYERSRYKDNRIICRIQLLVFQINCLELCFFKGYIDNCTCAGATKLPKKVTDGRTILDEH